MRGAHDVTHSWIAWAVIVVAAALFLWGMARGREMHRQPSRLREGFSSLPLGLCSREKLSKTHAIADIGKYEDASSWAKALASRSCRSTMLKQVPKAAAAWQMVVTSIHPRQLGAEHAALVLSHETRAMGPGCRARCSSRIRFSVARSMVGLVEEYRDGATGDLLAWTHLIVKGDTLRAMWFYSATTPRDAFRTRPYLWFHSVKRSVGRAIAMKGVRYVDLGTSTSAVVEELKAKFGFDVTRQWRERATYDGPFASWREMRAAEPPAEGDAREIAT